MSEHSIGDHPGLQAERTDLSWARTALSLMVNGGLLLLRHNFSGPNLMQLAGGGTALALAIFTFGVSRRRARVLVQRPLPAQLADPLSILLLAVGTAAFGVIAIGVFLAP